MTRFAANRPVADVPLRRVLRGVRAEESEGAAGCAGGRRRVVDDDRAAAGAEQPPTSWSCATTRGGPRVSDLIVVPKPFFTPEVIERRRAHAPQGALQPLGRLQHPAGRGSRGRQGGAGARGRGLAPRPRFLGALPPHAVPARGGGRARGGWLIEVFEVRRADRGPRPPPWTTCTPSRAGLAALYPANRNVRPKIRQQLQALRDAGLVAFEGRGALPAAGGALRRAAQAGGRRSAAAFIRRANAGVPGSASGAFSPGGGRGPGGFGRGRNRGTSAR